MGNTDQRAGTTGPESAIDDVNAKGAAALHDGKSVLDATVSDVTEMGQEALQRASDARHALSDMVLKSIKNSPYTTLAIAGIAGFAYGALRRR